MSFAALLQATRDVLQQNFTNFGLIPNASPVNRYVSIQPEGSPPGTIGDWFVSVDEGNTSAEGDSYLEETYAVRVFLTKRIGQYSSDRKGTAYIDASTNPVSGLDFLERQVIGYLHNNQLVRSTANTYANAPGAGGDVFIRPLSYRGRGPTQIMQGNWAIGLAPEEKTFMVRELRFETATRLQADSSLLGLVPEPTDLAATPSNTLEDTVSLAWHNNASNATNILVFRSTDNVSFSQIASISASDTSYVDATCTGGTLYYYKLQTVGTVSGVTTDSAYSIVATATTILSAASNLTATPSGSDETIISLAWQNNSASDVGYQIERSTDGSTFAQIATTTNLTSYNDTSCLGGTLYYYRVRDYSADGDESQYSNTASGTTIIAGPTNLVATEDGETSIGLSFTNNSNNAANFTIERSSTSGSGFSTLATVTGTTYSDTGLTGLATWYYKVVANSPEAVASVASSQASATTTLPPPTNLVVTDNGETELDLAWQNADSTQTGFKVERSADGVTFSQVGTTDSGTTSYADTGLSGLQLYYYRVRSTNANGNSAYSNTASNTTTFPAPSTLAVVNESGSETDLDLSWVTTSTTQTGIKIERSPDGSSFSQLTVTGSGATSYVDESCSGGTPYWYRIRATDANGNSAYSNTANATTTLFTPSGLSATGSVGQIVLNWTNVSAYQSGVAIERSTDNITFSQVTTIGASAVTYTNTGLAELTEYYYRIRDYKGSVYSAYSSTANATTSLLAPSGLTITSENTGAIGMTWSYAGTVATGFKIQSSADNSTWTDAGTVLAPTTTFTDSGLFSEDQIVYFRVAATDGAAISAYSSSAESVEPPLAPIDLAGTYNFDATVLTVGWTNESSIDDAYRLQWSNDGVSYTPVSLSPDTTPGDAITYTDLATTTDPEGELYYVKVDCSKSGRYSAQASTSFQSAPYAPTAGSYTYDYFTGAVLNWTNHSTVATGISVYLSNVSTSYGRLVQTLAPTVTSCNSFDSAYWSLPTAYYSVVATYNGQNSARAEFAVST